MTPKRRPNAIGRVRGVGREPSKSAGVGTDAVELQGFAFASPDVLEIANRRGRLRAAFLSHRFTRGIKPDRPNEIGKLKQFRRLATRFDTTVRITMLSSLAAII